MPLKKEPLTIHFDNYVTIAIVLIVLLSAYSLQFYNKEKKYVA